MSLCDGYMPDRSTAAELVFMVWWLIDVATSSVSWTQHLTRRAADIVNPADAELVPGMASNGSVIAC